MNTPTTPRELEVAGSPASGLLAANTEKPLGLGTCDDCGEFRGLTKWRDICICDDCLQFRCDG